MARIENSLKSIAVSFLGYVIRILVQFASRTVFILTLGKEYLGFSGLFSSILMLLSLAELGINTGIIYHLYEPIAQKDHEKIKALLKLYQKAYCFVGCSIGVMALLIIPFLPYLIKNPPDIPHLTWIYLFYAANSVLSYFFSYKRSIITADQKQYVISAYSSFCLIGMHLFQIIALLITKNYFVYLSLMLFFTLLENVLLSKKADRLYPYLKEHGVRPMTREEIAGIVDNIKALFLHKIGVVIIQGTDNLLLSKFFGLIVVGVYSNYTMITGALNSVTGIIYSSIAPSVGNLNVTESSETKLVIYNRIQFLTQWLFGFCSICLICLLNPFITLWLGADFVLPLPIVLVICVNYYLEGMRQPITISRSAMGLYIYARYKPVVEAALNLAISILLARQMGVIGIFLGTTISFLLTSFWIEPAVMYHHVFDLPFRVYLCEYLRSTAITILIGGLTYWLCSLIPNQSMIGFAGCVVICAVIPNLLYVLCYRKHPDFHYYLSFIKTLCVHKLR